MSEFSKILESDLTLKGAENSKVIKDIEIIVPIQKKNKYKIPEVKVGLVGKIANNTAALPAKPCTKPIK